MPNKEYVVTMAKYNLWQNESLTTAANELSEAERQLDRGSFFGSIQQTFSHILWGDQIWVSRFAGTEAPTLSIQESNKRPLHNSGFHLGQDFGIPEQSNSGCLDGPVFT